jgi:hypothetical protein
MRRAVILCGATSFIMAFLGGVLAISLLAPAAATAQSSQLQEVRASAFVLVADDGGTVLARIGPGPVGGGILSLYDPMARERLRLASGGLIAVYDRDGTAVFRAGVVDGRPGLTTPVNGVQLGPGGSIGSIPSEP